MKRLGFLQHRTWSAGIVLALAGSCSARFLVPQLPPERQALVLVPSQVIALLGLFLIAWGVSRRLRSSDSGT